jgi:transposase
LRPKRKKLAASGTRNPTPEKVQDHLFLSQAFFDPDDALQVKSEMLRRVERAGRSVTQATKDWGFSRRPFYDLQQQFATQGFPGLGPKKRGPKGAHKLTADVVDFLDKAREEIPCPKAAELARRVHARFGLSVHPRSLEKACTRKKKARTS